MKTLTFYSGKLWHSDKPFPGSLYRCPSFKGESCLRAGYCACALSHNVVKQWLCTAYEVVNAEGTIPGYDRVQKQWLKDGDQITLPEGYGIQLRKDYNFARITLPEKPDNSANGYTEGANIDYRPGFPSCTGRCQLTSGCNCPHGIQGASTDSTPIVEPSESHEENTEIMRASNVIRFLSEYIHGLTTGRSHDALRLILKNAEVQFNNLITRK